MLSPCSRSSSHRWSWRCSVSAAAAARPPGGQRASQAARRCRNLAPYVPTPQEVVDRMLHAGQGHQGATWSIDLGCGDGRIPITAAKVYGARGIGVDIDPQRIAEANANAKREPACRTW